MQIRARRVHDPANVLQRRLREAERKAFRAKLHQVQLVFGRRVFDETPLADMHVYASDILARL